MDGWMDGWMNALKKKKTEKNDICNALKEKLRERFYLPKCTLNIFSWLSVCPRVRVSVSVCSLTTAQFLSSAVFVFNSIPHPNQFNFSTFFLFLFFQFSLCLFTLLQPKRFFQSVLPNSSLPPASKVKTLVHKVKDFVLWTAAATLSISISISISTILFWLESHKRKTAEECGQIYPPNGKAVFRKRGGYKTHEGSGDEGNVQRFLLKTLGPPGPQRGDNKKPPPPETQNFYGGF